MLVYGECECFVMQMLYVCVFCASCGNSQCCVLHDLQFVNAGRGCNRRPYRRGILQSLSHNCFMLQTTQPTSGGAVTADSNCCANSVEPLHPQQWGPDLLLIMLPYYQLCNGKHCHCLQETHRANDRATPSIPGMVLVTECPHNKHGTSIFVRDSLKVNICEEDNVVFIAVELSGVVVHSVYQPPTEQFLLPPLGSRNIPHIVTGDFNNLNDGEAVDLLAESNNISLIHTATLLKAFNRAIWRIGYNPDLILASSNISNMCEKYVLDTIPHTQQSVSV